MLLSQNEQFWVFLALNSRTIRRSGREIARLSASRAKVGWHL